jgi:hypothetical protein
LFGETFSFKVSLSGKNTNVIIRPASICRALIGDFRFAGKSPVLHRPDKTKMAGKM